MDRDVPPNVLHRLLRLHPRDQEIPDRDHVPAANLAEGVRRGQLRLAARRTPNWASSALCISPNFPIRTWSPEFAGRRRQEERGRRKACGGERNGEYFSSI
ncbi:hypothetical protein FH972_011861 [Carpinus fangiana]|uniref:Uncharacterized protein n=1 Tax=Carpinus fangiana TaxID=176857 RepID=A0A660KUD4_9ROSI|nr:hypothetical protein FH972_011861 [Carpinus fangiana]